jgi:large subunit ribosomal protein L21
LLVAVATIAAMPSEAFEAAVDSFPRSARVAWPIAMYAVIDAGATQQKVSEGEQVQVDLLDAADGDEVTLPARLVVDGDQVLATPEQLAGVSVTGRVVGVAKGPKINGFTYKRRTNQRRRYGHRQRYTVVEITKISAK